MRTIRDWARLLALLGTSLIASFILSACEGKSGADGQSATLPVAPTPTELNRQDDAPGVVLSVVSITGGRGPNGSFAVGDSVTVTFTVKKSDGTPWQIEEMASSLALVSGPTFNYQRVIAQQNDVITKSELVSPGTYRYAFADRIPAAYPTQLNHTDSSGLAEGELTGQPLLEGTYTVGMTLYWRYTVGTGSFRDAGNLTADFVVGGGTTITSRDVVGQANCNAGHRDLRAHGGSRKEVKLCVLCHTSGALDRNVPPTSIDFRVMIHRIHDGEHLPSVQGVSTNSDGTRNYAASPTPYTIVGGGNRGSDFSTVGFPVWPNLAFPMPRDSGYSTLSSAQKLLEDTIREGVTDCNKCHGDPDGAGPLVAPSQGDIAFAQPTRRACGSCHDDVVWSYPYVANTQTMPANVSNAACILCHPSSGNALSARDAHRHPLTDPNVNPGLDFVIESVGEGGTNNGDGAIDVGEKVRLRFSITDDAGNSVAPSSLSSITAVISGPMQNRSLLINPTIPLAALTGSQPFDINVPRSVTMEFVGRSTSTLGDTFATQFSPHWVVGATTTVLVRTGTVGAPATLMAGAEVLANFVDVTDPGTLARDNIVVIDESTSAEEYLKIALVDGDRVWFTTPLRFSHTVGALVQGLATATKVAGTDYTLDAANGVITEVTEFGDGSAVLVSYTTDFVMPAVYNPPLNDSPDLDESVGEWKGKSIVAGTYSLGLYGSRSLTVTRSGEATTYTAGAPPATETFRVGSPASSIPIHSSRRARTAIRVTTTSCSTGARAAASTRASCVTESRAARIGRNTPPRTRPRRPA
ncbi:MAG: hypothetical protein HY292_20625 [Planctomycetes bacterium]|nr:hypothetical protein [Planctomycetota bacterium]